MLPSANLIAPRILVVDDMREMADYFRSWFEAKAYRVTCAYDGESALAIARETEPDVLLVNWLMPGLTGLDVLKELRKDAAGRKVKIILTSSTKKITALTIQALREGADDCIQLPCAVEEVWEAVERALQNESHSTPH